MVLLLLRSQLSEPIRRVIPALNFTAFTAISKFRCIGMDTGEYDPNYLPIGLDHWYDVEPRYLVQRTEKRAEIADLRSDFASVLEYRSPKHTYIFHR